MVPIREEERRGQGIVTITRGTRPGALTGIDMFYYQNAYPETAVVYGLYPIREPDQTNLAPMRLGRPNCIAQRVIEHFEGTFRGQGQTVIRCQKIEEWEAEVHLHGATVADVANLEKIFKRAIVLKDIVGGDIYNSGKYGRGGNGYHRPIELIYHNGHAWPKDLHFPQARRVWIYEGDVWTAIRQVTEGNPMAVWQLGGEGKQLNVTQFVLEDGRVFRTRETHERLIEVCHRLGDESLAERVFGENHAASIKARENNGWKPTPASLLEDIQKACVEYGHGGLWNLTGYDVESLVSIDMKSCYPASFSGYGEAKPYYERFGHPAHGMVRVAINGALLADMGTGFAEVQEWEFEESIHPMIPAWYGEHFFDKGWAPISLLVFLTGKGILGEGIISFGKQTDVWLPENRD